jgi:hypothetical protein
MSAEPAREPDNLHQLQPATVPYAKFQVVTEALTEAQARLSAIEGLFAGEQDRHDAKVKRLENRVAELEDEGAPEEGEVKEFLEWWVGFTGRIPGETRIGKTTKRAKLVRQTYRQLGKIHGDQTLRIMALAVVGNAQSAWHRSQGFTDIQDIFKDEARIERFVQMGRDHYAKQAAA